MGPKLLVKISNFDAYKVQLFWESHKNLHDRPYGFDNYLRQNHKEDCANFCGLLRKAELYQFHEKNVQAWAV